MADDAGAHEDDGSGGGFMSAVKSLIARARPGEDMSRMSVPAVLLMPRGLNELQVELVVPRFYILLAAAEMGGTTTTAAASGSKPAASATGKTDDDDDDDDDDDEDEEEEEEEDEADELRRMLVVVRYFMAQFFNTARPRKPLNPVIGETVDVYARLAPCGGDAAPEVPDLADPHRPESEDGGDDDEAAGPRCPPDSVSAFHRLLASTAEQDDQAEAVREDLARLMVPAVSPNRTARTASPGAEAGGAAASKTSSKKKKTKKKPSTKGGKGSAKQKRTKKNDTASAADDDGSADDDAAMSAARRQLVGQIRGHVEQISHHPPGFVVHARHEDSGIVVTKAVHNISTRFVSAVARVEHDGQMRVHFERARGGRGETYVCTRLPDVEFRVLRMTQEHTNVSTIFCPESGLGATIHYKSKPMMGGRWHEVSGSVFRARASADASSAPGANKAARKAARKARAKAKKAAKAAAKQQKQTAEAAAAAAGSDRKDEDGGDDDDDDDDVDDDDDDDDDDDGEPMDPAVAETLFTISGVWLDDDVVLTPVSARVGELLDLEGDDAVLLRWNSGLMPHLLLEEDASGQRSTRAMWGDCIDGIMAGDLGAAGRAKNRTEVEERRLRALRETANDGRHDPSTLVSTARARKRRGKTADDVPPAQSAADAETGVLPLSNFQQVKDPLATRLREDLRAPDDNPRTAARALADIDPLLPQALLADAVTPIKPFPFKEVIEPEHRRLRTSPRTPAQS